MSFEPAEALARLKRCADEDRVAHAYLIAGPVETAQREIVGPWLASLLGRDPEHHPDVFRVSPMSKLRQITISQIRQLDTSLHQTSMLGGWKAALLIEADRLMPQAANAFLKTLEEPAPRTVILLLSAASDQLLPTIRSRCLTLRLAHSGQPQPPEDLRPVIQAAATADRSDPLTAYRCLHRLSAYLDAERSRLQKAADQQVRQARQEGLEAEALDDFKKLQNGQANTDYLRQRRDALSHLAHALAARRLRDALLVEQAHRDLSGPLQEAFVLERLFLKLFLPHPKRAPRHKSDLTRRKTSLS